MRREKTFETEIKQSLDEFLAPFLGIFGRKPRFALSVFCVEKGESIRRQRLASSLYSAEAFADADFQARLMDALFRAENDILGEIRNYENFFPDFYHKFLRTACEEKTGGRMRFFDLPRYTYENRIYFPVFSLDMAWLEESYAAAGRDGEDGAVFFTLLLETLRTFLETETRIVEGKLSIDEYQIQRLHALAAAGFLGGITGNSYFYNYINTIASLKYEKKECAAQIAFCRSHKALPLLVRFARPILMSEHRKVRKLLAATGEKHCLVSSGEHLEGIADIKKLETAAEAPVYFFNLLKHLTWELVHEGRLLLRYNEGRLSTDRYELKDGDILAFAASRLAIGAEAAGRVLALVKAARGAGHGSILVFIRSAATEARRLKRDCFLVEPFMLDAGDLPSLTVMDGALLIDAECRCHALGVILDGEGVHTSDTSRGARFNSSLRYLEKNKDERILIVVVSDDGMINLIPDPAG